MTPWFLSGSSERLHAPAVSLRLLVHFWSSAAMSDDRSFYCTDTRPIFTSGAPKTRSQIGRATVRNLPRLRNPQSMRCHEVCPGGTQLGMRTRHTDPARAIPMHQLGPDKSAMKAHTLQVAVMLATRPALLPWWHPDLKLVVWLVGA